MPLTTRTNGSGGSNVIQASWFNDFLNLLTGSMTDQEVKITNNLKMQAIGSGPGAPTLALATGTSLGIGLYTYVITFTSPDGESLIGTSANITTTSGNQKVSLTAIPTGSTGVTGRNIYRTKVGGTSNNTFYFVASIADNTTTTYTDSTADGSLGSQQKGYTTLGGSVQVQDAGAVVRAGIANDGTWIMNQNPIVLNGGISGTASMYQWMQGALKTTWIVLNGFRTSSSAQILTLPQPYTIGAQYKVASTEAWALLSSTGSAVSVAVWTSGNSSSGSNGGVGFQANPGGDNHGWSAGSFNQVQFAASWASTHTGLMIFEGV